MPSTWLRKSSKLPYHQPSLMAELTTALAKTPVNSIPTIPPTPWHGNTSRVSSMVERDFQCTNILDTTLAISPRSEEHTSELQSLMRNSYAVFCLKTKNTP